MGQNLTIKIICTEPKKHIPYIVILRNL